MTVQSSRIKKLNSASVSRGDYVLYWMQQSQRAEENHALEYAVDEANMQNQALIVVFGLMKNYPEANIRHYTFMLEGLKEVKETLASRGILMVVRIGDPVKEVLKLGRKACLIVCDRGYMRHQVAWRKAVAERSTCPVVQVETDVIVPVEAVSDKAEYAAYTIRPKLNRRIDTYLIPVDKKELRVSSLELPLQGLELKDTKTALSDLEIDDSIPPVSQFFKGGTSEAKARFEHFLDRRFHRYADHRNKPENFDISGMSPYLHFGQISPLFMALKLRACESCDSHAKDIYLEELIVRRELAMNFVNYNPSYDSLDCLPGWAKKTLRDHAGDHRESLYSISELVGCRTHDEYWNAAMREMTATGFMHNYMRMYWGKKILEWSRTPEDAYDTLITLNNTYFLDGRDPNSYAGVGWIFGLHDRAWFERPVFGKVRYMTASGLERKCDIKAYVDRVARISEEQSLR